MKHFTGIESSTTKEGAMATNEKQIGFGIGPERVYPTASHRVLGMTHEELLVDMARRGHTKQEALAIFDRVGAALRPPSRPTAVATRSLPELVARGFGPAFLPALPMYEERVAAGTGAQLGDDPESRPAALSDLFGNQDWSSLIVARVSGSSMVGDSIQDGDAVLVDTRREARNGDIVLAHLAGHGQMVKRLRREGPFRAVLQSANSAFPPITIDDPAALTIHGVVVARSGKL